MSIGTLIIFTFFVFFLFFFFLYFNHFSLKRFLYQLLFEKYCWLLNLVFIYTVFSLVFSYIHSFIHSLTHFPRYTCMLFVSVCFVFSVMYNMSVFRNKKDIQDKHSVCSLASKLSITKGYAKIAFFC